MSGSKKKISSSWLSSSSSSSSVSNEVTVITSPCSDPKPSAFVDDSSPIRHFLCLKVKDHIKLYEEREDCFILDFDPYESDDLTKKSLQFNQTDSVEGKDGAKEDLIILGEKGQVACRDYPHPRYLCVKFPFEATSHNKYCDQCYCYVCDCAAPCRYWEEFTSKGHCHATAHDQMWKLKRKSWRKNR